VGEQPAAVFYPFRHPTPSASELRTKGCLDQKNKAEELLYSLMPTGVASQLLAGDAVVPEKFDCVSIYFSDIVSFTPLAAASTPFEAWAYGEGWPWTP
jgi:hypothetical protein